LAPGSLSELFALELESHFGEVHEVSALGQLAVVAGDEGGAEEAGLFAGGGKAESVAVVEGGTGPADGDAVSLGEELVDVDVEVRKGAKELAMDGFEAFRAGKNRVGVGKTVDLALRVEEFVDGCFAGLIPDFFKPASCEGLVLI
jgi:hypothetical protein